MTLMLCRSQQARFRPRERHVAEGHEIILSLNFGQLGVEGQIDPKPGQRLQKTTEPPGRGIQNTVGAVRIIEAIAECAIRTGQRPIRRLPGIRTASNPEDQPSSFDAERNILASGHKCAHSAQNLGTNLLEVALPQQPNRWTIAQLRIQASQPSLHNRRIVVVL